MATDEFVAVDVETTGMSPSRGHRIIEIGAVRLVNGSLGQEFHSLINCGGGITKEAQRVHGITDAMLSGQPKAEDVFQAFRSFIDHAVLVAHNAQFDNSFLRSEYDRLGWRFSNRIVCTLELSRQHLHRLPNHRLETVARHLLGDLSAEARLHRALGDAKLTAKVWLKLRWGHG